jgi:hypothetical protein
MNKPMMIAEDNDIVNYYIDTDSMHIQINQVAVLGQLFEEEVGYPLLGNDFGQFKCDFALEDEQGRPCRHVQSTSTRILGKKCYLDLLEGINPDGATVTGYHARMKGCSKAAMLEMANQLSAEANQSEEPMKDKVARVYDVLLQGEKLVFNLLAKGEGAKLGFVANKDFTTHTRDTFNRTYYFPGDVIHC